MGTNVSDVVVVGSGINALVCAAMLSVAGRSVTVLERSPLAGGCMRTEELFPGYRHDVMASWYPLFVHGPAYAALRTALDRVDKLVPYNVEERIQERGAHYSKALLPFCLLYTSPSPRDRTRSRMPSSA